MFNLILLHDRRVFTRKMSKLKISDNRQIRQIATSVLNLPNNRRYFTLKIAKNRQNEMSSAVYRRCK